MIHSFLLIGQSNMAGRGSLSEAAPLPKDTRIRVLRNGRWQKLFRPIHTDRAFAGYCLAESFAEAYAKEHNVDVGLIPCADGGTSLNQWREGGLLYDNALLSARLAMRTSSLAGILWHQGESDCHDHLYPLYFDKLSAIICALRRDLSAEDIPFIVGGLGDFLKYNKGMPYLKNYGYINDALKKIAATSHRLGYVSPSALTADVGDLHFDTKSLCEFGLRYYDVFKTLEDKDRVFEEKADMDLAFRTEMENL